MFKGVSASEWEDRFHTKARECDDIAKQLKSAQDAVRSMEMSIQEGEMSESSGVVCESVLQQGAGLWLKHSQGATKGGLYP